MGRAVLFSFPVFSARRTRRFHNALSPGRSIHVFIPASAVPSPSRSRIVFPADASAPSTSRGGRVFPFTAAVPQVLLSRIIPSRNRPPLYIARHAPPFTFPLRRFRGFSSKPSRLRPYCAGRGGQSNVLHDLGHAPLRRSAAFLADVAVSAGSMPPLRGDTTRILMPYFKGIGHASLRRGATSRSCRRGEIASPHCAEAQFPYLTERERVQFHAPITGDAARTALTPRRRAHHVPHCAEAQRFPIRSRHCPASPSFPHHFFAEHRTGWTTSRGAPHSAPLLGRFQGFCPNPAACGLIAQGAAVRAMFFTTLAMPHCAGAAFLADIAVSTGNMPPLRGGAALPHPQPSQQFSFPKLSPQNRPFPQHCTKHTALRPAAQAFPEGFVSSRITQYFFIAARQAVRLPTRRAYTLFLLHSTASTVSAISARPNSAAAIRPRASSAAPCRNASVRPSASCRGEKSEP